jgi:hypothetical protein
MELHTVVSHYDARHPREDIQRLWHAFAPLPFDLRSRALRLGEIHTARAGDRYVPSEELAVLLSGCLLLEVGHTKVCAGVARAGDMVGLGGGTRGRWLVAGSLYRAPIAEFLTEAGDDGLSFLLTAGAMRTERVENRLACGIAHPALSRVASLLWEADQSCNGPDVPLCQSDIGDMLSLRRTSVNGACQTLRVAGAVRTVRGRTIVLDRAALAAHACCGRAASANAFACSGPVGAGTFVQASAGA